MNAQNTGNGALPATATRHALGDAVPDPLERHFSPEVLAQIWGFDTSTIRRMFQDEPGVLKVGKSGRRDGKRDYITLRIPESVVQRVYREKVKRA
jgi:hypothetical protein